MITIKTGAYTAEQIRLLSQLFGEMEKTLLTEYCNNGRCIVCPYRHICDDIHSVNDFLSKKSKV